jgi:hypothetical protein
MERHGANPVKMLLGPIVQVHVLDLFVCGAGILRRGSAHLYAQAPIFLSFFLSTRRLAEWEPSLMQVCVACVFSAPGM